MCTTSTTSSSNVPSAERSPDIENEPQQRQRQQSTTKTESKTPLNNPPTMKSDSAAAATRTQQFPPTNEQQRQRPLNALATANWYSRLFFTWPYPLLRLGMQRVLRDADQPACLPRDTSRYALKHFNAVWQAERARHPQQPSLRRALARDYFRSVWFAQPLMLASAIAKVTQAVMLGRLIDFLQGGNNQGYLWAGILVLCGAVLLFEHHHLFFHTWRKGMQLRISCIAAIYDKSLRLSSTSTSASSSYGKIMNLVEELRYDLLL